VQKEICFIMPNMSGGGAQRVVSILANELCLRGYKVYIFLTHTDICEYKIDANVQIIPICSKDNNSALNQMIAIHKKMKLMPNATFISFLDNQNVFSVIARFGTKAKVIISQRNDPHQAFSDRKYMQPLDRLIYILANAAVFQTEEAKKYYPSLGKNHYFIILNPLNENIPKRFEGKRTKRIVTVCRLNKQKNLFLAIDVFSEFVKSHPDFTFEIYGKGELKESLLKYVEQLNLSSKVVFKGFQNDVYSQIVDASVFLISSDFEGLSNAMLEALAMGIPTVATDCPIGGARMVMQNNLNGCLVPIQDKFSMLKALDKIVNNEDFQKQLSIEAIKIRNNLSIKNICNKWIDVIESVWR